jgi:hypothetical protein
LSLKLKTLAIEEQQPSPFSSRSRLRTGPMSIWRTRNGGTSRRRRVASLVLRASLRAAVSQDVITVFEATGTAVTLQRHAEVIRPN